MTGTTDLILYSRSDCHLCELAAAMLRGMKIDCPEVDIDGDAALAERYGLSVPVLRNAVTHEELCYPFSEDDIRRLLDSDA